MTLRLRCVRCGNWHERDALDHYLPWICVPCFSKGMDIMFGEGTHEETGRRYDRWLARWWKNVPGHPTDKALSAALDALEATPHGRLDDQLVIVDAVMLGEPIA